MFEYNDYILVDMPFGKVTAKFLCCRPDKKTVVIDHNNRLHEAPYNKVKKLHLFEINKFYNNTINKYFNAELSCKDSIKKYINDIRKKNEKIKKLEFQIQEMEDKIESLKLLIELRSNENIFDKKDNDELYNSTECLDSLKKDLSETYYFIKGISSSLFNSLKQRKRARKLKQEWKSQYENWKGELTNENRQRLEKISQGCL